VPPAGRGARCAVRSYHIMYQLCKGASADEVERYRLLPLTDFVYPCRGNCIDVPSIDDVADFASTKRAMTCIGISAEQQHDFFRVLSSVLHLGNIRIGKDADDNALVSLESLETAAHMLALAPTDVQYALCQRRISTPTDIITVCNTAEQAAGCREALAKALYDWLFAKLVASINAACHDNRPICFRTGVLDIFGFEKFHINRFEQFCINYANEKLQYQFSQTVFQHEQQEYMKEKIEWRHVDFTGTGLQRLRAMQPQRVRQHRPPRSCDHPVTAPAPSPLHPPRLSASAVRPLAAA
jgi:myosin heavy subunit